MFPLVDGLPSLDKLRTLLSHFTIVGKTPALLGGNVVDIGRTCMLHEVTEHSEFILSQSDIRLGPLGGTQKKAKRYFRTISVKEQHARDAMNTLLGRRPSPTGTDAVDAAFGAEPPAVPPPMLAVEDAPFARPGV